MYLQRINRQALIDMSTIVFNNNVITKLGLKSVRWGEGGARFLFSSFWWGRKLNIGIDGGGVLKVLNVWKFHQPSPQLINNDRFASLKLVWQGA